jgi:long-chain acyl-CoA synthetase
MSRGLERAAEEHPERVALLVGEERLTFGELDAQCNTFARQLSAAGVVAGHRVAVMIANRPEFVVAVHGISRLGAAAVLLNPGWKTLEVAHAVRITGAAHAIADAATAPVLRGALGAARVMDIDAESTKAELSRRDRAPLPEQRTHGGDDAVLVFSSGTTGLPKAVRHTHRSLGVATQHWRVALGLGPDDRFQVATPPSHILGLLNLLAAAEAGAAVRLHLRFDLDEVLRRIETDRMTLEWLWRPSR